MNNRIKELVTQATRPRGPAKPAEFDKEYFAELIVRECILQIQKIQTDAKSSHADEEIILTAIRSTCLVCNKQILNHFGLKQ